jgi:hypothetical protein
VIAILPVPGGTKFRKVLCRDPQTESQFWSYR